MTTEAAIGNCSENYLHKRGHSLKVTETPHSFLAKL